MKVIFLDFDGVLNSEKYVRNCGEYGVVIDPARMLLLKQIVDATKAEIVLSTSWREHWSREGSWLNDIFERYGLKIRDKTPKLHSKREQEIEAWLMEHEDVETFVVLDDAFLSAAFLEGHFVKTANFRDGLDEDDVERAIEILNK